VRRRKGENCTKQGNEEKEEIIGYKGKYHVGERMELNHPTQS